MDLLFLFVIYLLAIRVRGLVLTCHVIGKGLTNIYSTNNYKKIDTKQQIICFNGSHKYIIDTIFF